MRVFSECIVSLLVTFEGYISAPRVVSLKLPVEGNDTIGIYSNDTVCLGQRDRKYARVLIFSGLNQGETTFWPDVINTVIMHTWFVKI